MRTTTHCANGHERTPENLNKARRCRICETDRRRTMRVCKRGHERTPANTYKDGTCRTCKNENNKAYRAAQNTLPQPTPTEQARIDHNRRGVIHYIERRRQRLAQQEKAA